MPVPLRSQKHRWKSIVLAVLATVPVLVTLAACARSTPTCDQAFAMVTAGQLGDAAAAYALARERSEGDCADAGLANVKNQYGDAYVDVAKGRVAEDGKDVQNAIADYRAALVIDSDNPTAKAGLARLNQPVPKPEPFPNAQPAASPGQTIVVPPLLVALIAIAVVLLLAMAGLLGWTISRWRGWTTAQQGQHADLHTDLIAAKNEVRQAEKSLGAKLEAGRNQAADAAKSTDARLDRHDNALRAVQTSIEKIRSELATRAEKTSSELATQSGKTSSELATLAGKTSSELTTLAGKASTRVNELEQHLDDVLEALTELVSDGGQPTRQRYVRDNGKQ